MSVGWQYCFIQLFPFLRVSILKALALKKSLAECHIHKNNFLPYKTCVWEQEWEWWEWMVLPLWYLETIWYLHPKVMVPLQHILIQLLLYMFVPLLPITDCMFLSPYSFWLWQYSTCPKFFLLNWSLFCWSSTSLAQCNTEVRCQNNCRGEDEAWGEGMELHQLAI